MYTTAEARGHHDCKIAKTIETLTAMHARMSLHTRLDVNCDLPYRVPCVVLCGAVRGLMKLRGMPKANE